MAAAAAGDGAVDTQEAGEAQAGALNAVAVVRTLVRTEHFARQSAVTHIACTFTVLSARAAAIAIVRAYLGWNCAECHAFEVGVDGRRRLHQGQWLHLHSQRQSCGLDLRAVGTLISGLAAAPPCKAVAYTRAIIWATQIAACGAEPSLAAEAVSLQAHASAVAIMWTALGVAKHADPSWRALANVAGGLTDTHSMATAVCLTLGCHS